MFKKTLDRGEAGDNLGVLMRGLKKDVIQELAELYLCFCARSFEIV